MDHLETPSKRRRSFSQVHPSFHRETGKEAEMLLSQGLSGSLLDLKNSALRTRERDLIMLLLSLYMQFRYLSSMASWRAVGTNTLIDILKTGYPIATFPVRIHPLRVSLANLVSGAVEILIRHAGTTGRSETAETENNEDE